MGSCERIRLVLWREFRFIDGFMGTIGFVGFLLCTYNCAQNVPLEPYY